MKRQVCAAGEQAPILAFSSKAGPRVLLMCSTALRTPRKARERVPIPRSIRNLAPPKWGCPASTPVLNPKPAAVLSCPHLCPGSGICLHLSVPGLHRSLWKLHWAQLLGIGLGARNHSHIRVPPTSKVLRAQLRDQELEASPNSPVRLEDAWGQKRIGPRSRSWHWGSCEPPPRQQWAWITLGCVQVHLHRGVAPGVQDFPGEDFLHGHGCEARGVSVDSRCLKEPEIPCPLRVFPTPSRQVLQLKIPPQKGH